MGVCDLCSDGDEPSSATRKYCFIDPSTLEHIQFTFLLNVSAFYGPSLRETLLIYTTIHCIC